MNHALLTGMQIIALYRISMALNFSWTYALESLLYGYDDEGNLEFLTRGTYEWDTALLLFADDEENEAVESQSTDLDFTTLRYSVQPLFDYLNIIASDEGSLPFPLIPSVAQVTQALARINNGTLHLTYKTVEIVVAPDQVQLICRRAPETIPYLSVAVPAKAVVALDDSPTARSALLSSYGTPTADEVWEVYPILASLIGERSTFFQLSPYAILAAAA